MNEVDSKIRHLIDLMCRWHYIPARRLETIAVTVPPTDKQWDYIKDLAAWNRTEISEITEMLFLAWGCDMPDWTMADAQFVIGALRKRRK